MALIDSRPQHVHVVRSKRILLFFLSNYVTVIHKCIGGKEKLKYSEIKLPQYQLFCHEFHID